MHAREFGVSLTLYDIIEPYIISGDCHCSNKYSPALSRTLNFFGLVGTKLEI
jgi:hypothetical protein